MTEGSMLHYLGLFIFYTLVAIGIIYGLFWVIRKNPALLQMGRKSLQFKQVFEIEQVLPLEPRKNLYIIRAGNERFLVATSMEGTQFLSKLEEKPVEAGESANLLSGTPEKLNETADQETKALEGISPMVAASTFQGRLMQSLRWIISSRIKLT